MTKEEKLAKECYEICRDKAISSDCEFLYSTIMKFFESNVCIPKGENRHKDADVLHEAIENPDICLQELSIMEWYSISVQDAFNWLSRYRIKPSEPIYEWQWKFKHPKNNSSMWDGFTMYVTDAQFEEIKMDWMQYEKDESTKRERK